MQSWSGPGGDGETIYPVMLNDVTVTRFIFYQRDIRARQKVEAVTGSSLDKGRSASILGAFFACFRGRYRELDYHY